MHIQFHTYSPKTWILQSILKYNISYYCIILSYNLLHCIVLYYILFYCIIFYFIALYYIRLWTKYTYPTNNQRLKRSRIPCAGSCPCRNWSAIGTPAPAQWTPWPRRVGETIFMGHGFNSYVKFYLRVFRIYSHIIYIYIHTYYGVYIHIYTYHRSLDTVCCSIDQGCFARGYETTRFTNFLGLTSMIILVVDQLIWGSLTSPVCVVKFRFNTSLSERCLRRKPMRNNLDAQRFRDGVQCFVNCYCPDQFFWIFLFQMLSQSDWL